MIKQTLGAVCLGLMVSVATPAVAFELPKLPAADPAADAATDEELKRLNEKQSLLLQRVHLATVKVLDGVVLMHRAAGDEAEATRIQEVAKKLTESKADDQARLKEADAEVRAIASKLKQTKFPVRKLSLDERKWLSEGMLAANAVSLANADVARQAAVLSTEAASLTTGLMANPMKLMKARALAPSVAFVNQLAASQAESARAIAEAMGRYAVAHQLEAPSPDEIQQVVDMLVKP